MKTSFTIKSMEVEVVVAGEKQVVRTPEIHTDMEATISELKALYELKKEILAEAPALIEKFSTEIANVWVNTAVEFKKAEEKVNTNQKMERHINEWFTEFFLAPDITKHAIDVFDKFFCNSDEKPFEISRKEFLSLPYKKKFEFYCAVCDTEF